MIYLDTIFHILSSSGSLMNIRNIKDDITFAMHILIRHQYGKMEDMAMTDYEQEGKKS
jgi:hypothetical protein